MPVDWPTTDAAPTLADGQVHVWAVELDKPARSRNDLWAMLSDDERRRAERFLYDQPRNRFVAARGALRLIVSKYVVGEAAGLKFSYGPHGKPALQSLAPDDVHFNMAHSADVALIALSRHGELGIDVESLRPVRHATEITERYFHPDEVARITTSDDLERAFFRCWTRKEAVLKAIGAGLQFPLRAFDTGIESTSQQVHVPAHQSVAATDCWLQDLAVGSDTLAALATFRAVDRPQLYSFAP